MYDAIIVGARCAGSPVAMLLARKGYKVLLVDRGTFPSDTMSTHYIHQPGVACLQRWGLLDGVEATGCPPISRIKLDLGPIVLDGSPPPADDCANAFSVRRKYLDKILVDAAIDAGAELRENFTVRKLLVDADGAVTGLTGSTGAIEVTEQARIVIGADGLHSVVARSVQAPTYNEKPSLSCGYYSYWSGVNVDEVEWYPRVGQMAVAFPTNDGLVCVSALRTNDQFHAYRADLAGTFFHTLEEASPSLAARVRAGRQEERFVGTADLPNFYRRPFGPGWALVGDAGHHKDPITARGITDAFRDAELLADAVDAAFTERAPLESAMAAYEQQRNEVTLPIYELTTQLASLEPSPPDMTQLFAALAGNQEATNGFLGLVAGTTPFHAFFAPENIGRIVGAGGAAPA